MKTEIEVRGAEIESSTVESVSAEASLQASAQSVTIEQIAGDVKLESRLQDGKVEISFSPHFDWGIRLATMAEKRGEERLHEQLKAVGLSEDHIAKVVEIIENEPIDLEVSELRFVDESSKVEIGDETHELREVPEGRATSLPLPSIPINLYPSIDVQNLKIENISLGAETTLSAVDLKTTTTPLDDFSVVTDTPDLIAYTKAEVEKTRLQPLTIPHFGLPNIHTSLDISQFGAKELPISIDSNTGGADISLKLLDWHPRWTREICIKVWKFKKCVWIEFGVNLRIVLRYKWVLHLLRVSMQIRNAFLNGIRITVKLAKIALDKIKIGLFNAAKITARAIK